ncbi:hypothetical protein EVAR_39251_1 [Eumeta japonica]|uniref:Uncharacterized protein n=1 Tax=Eumeta variegata TaxID=151549 RepID=A0A4C1Y0M0_EUMVA|nr:hypothetical protein EVAR_39251_1 [Eumeta japonica]
MFIRSVANIKINVDQLPGYEEGQMGAVPRRNPCKSYFLRRALRRRPETVPRKFFNFPSMRLLCDVYLFCRTEIGLQLSDVGVWVRPFKLRRPGDARSAYVPYLSLLLELHISGSVILE